jgi:excinuclease UvrABC nuclease subunit
MNEDFIYFFKCDKCGNKITASRNDISIPCLDYALYRTSGICGGSYIRDLSEERELKLSEVLKNKKDGI